MPRQVQPLSWEMLDAAWFLEFTLVTAAWVILRHGGTFKDMLKPRAILEGVLLFLALSCLTLFSNALIGGGSYFLLLRLVVQGVITAAYLFNFSLPFRYFRGNRSLMPKERFPRSPSEKGKNTG